MMPSNNQLTEVERSVLRGLERATVKHRNPSLAEIADFTKPQISLSGIRRALLGLAAKGYVELTVRRARGVRQLRPSPSKKQIKSAQSGERGRL